MAENEVYRSQCHSRVPSKGGVGAKYLVLILLGIFCIYVLLYLQDTCGNEKLPAAILNISTWHLGDKIKLF